MGSFLRETRNLLSPFKFAGLKLHEKTKEPIIFQIERSFKNKVGQICDLMSDGG